MLSSLRRREWSLNGQAQSILCFVLLSLTLYSCWYASPLQQGVLLERPSKGDAGHHRPAVCPAGRRSVCQVVALWRPRPRHHDQGQNLPHTLPGGCRFLMLQLGLFCFAAVQWCWVLGGAVERTALLGGAVLASTPQQRNRFRPAGACRSECPAGPPGRRSRRCQLGARA